MTTSSQIAALGLQHLRPSPATVTMRRQRAQFWRGGTSNAILIKGEDLPEWRSLKERYPQHSNMDMKVVASTLQPIFQAIMGSPDPYGRQLNGMGGGVSSLSKAMVIDQAQDEHADVDYLFIQIGIKDGKLDVAGNCGNMSSAVGPFALNENLLDWQKLRSGHPWSIRGATPGQRRMTQQLSARLRNLNTSRIIVANFRASEHKQGPNLAFEEHGDYILDGVPGYASPITLSFTSPGGAKTGKALPTGNPVDTISIDGEEFTASLLDISNPGVFIDGRQVKWDPARKPEDLTANEGLMAKLEMIRQAGAVMMGMDPETSSVPKIVLLFPPASEDVDITCQALSMEQAHKAVPMTLGLNLGVACKIPGTIANHLARQRDGKKTIVGHPSGRVEVGADIAENGDILSAQVIRTARCLMEGHVNVELNEKWTPEKI